MAKRIPTHPGDVLILRTTQSYAVHAVGRVSKDGQQDFGGEANVKYEIDYPAAVAQAKPLSYLDGGFSFGTSTQATGMRFHDGP